MSRSMPPTVRVRRVTAGTPTKVRVYDDSLRRQEESFDDETDAETTDAASDSARERPIRVAPPSEDSSSADDTSDEEADAVRQDMIKLEQSFGGFRHKYKLISKIGEGEPTKLSRGGAFEMLTEVQAHSPRSTRQRISSTTPSETTGMSRAKRTRHDRHPAA